MKTKSMTDRVAAAINEGAFGSNYVAKVWRKDGGADRVYVTRAKRDIGYIVVAGDTYDTSGLRLPSALFGKADGYIAAELAK